MNLATSMAKSIVDSLRGSIAENLSKYSHKVRNPLNVNGM